MHESLKSRRETVGDEAPEHIKAIETLQNAGILIPISQLDIYHGRSGDGKKWKIEGVDNANNNTGHRNVNNIPALHASDESVATRFAYRRAINEHGAPEVHQIASLDPDASIFNRDFDWSSLSDEESRLAQDAIRKTLPRIFEGSPLKFEDRHVVDRLSLRDFTTNRTYGGYISKQMVEEYAKKNEISLELSEQICGAINARSFLGNMPQALMRQVVDAFYKDTGQIKATVGDRLVTFPINREYVARWLQKIHAVGANSHVYSATLNGEKIVDYQLFDHEHIDTRTEIDKKRLRTMRRLGKLALSLHEHQITEPAERTPNPMLEALEDLYVSPHQLVKAAKKVPGFKELFDADAGNWEKFTLGEHTETVLRNFDYNYADKLPGSLLPIMRLCLLTHDIGKSVAVRNRDKANQTKYNLQYAEIFMQSVGIDDRTREFVARLIGPGKEMTENIIFRNRGNMQEVRRFCTNTFQRFTGYQPSDEDARGIFQLCLILQTCDSAAYTDMALTRSVGNRGVFYRNSPSFNSAFEGSHGLTGRKTKLKFSNS